MFNLHDSYATDVVPIRCNSNTVHSFVIRFAPQVMTEICFTVYIMSIYVYILHICIYTVYITIW